MGVKRIIAVLGMVALVAGACGDATEPPPPPAPPPATAAPPPPSTPSPPPAAEPAVLTEPGVMPASAGVTRADPTPDAPIEQLVTGFNDAGFVLWTAQPVEGNLVFSPASIGHALLMARAAADGPTGTAIDTALALPPGRAAHQAWNAVATMIGETAAAADEVTVTIADRIWPGLGVVPDQEWVDVLAAEHGASVEVLDYAGDPAGSLDRINGWVGEQTRGLIPELLPEGFVDRQTVLVLSDAVYFAARWAQVFGKYGTEIHPFTRRDGSTTDVELMRQLDLSEPRGWGDGFVGAEIPYQRLGFSMLLIVPDAGRFEEVRSRLSQDVLDEIDVTFTRGPYELLVPQWTIATQLDLVPWLTEIGAAPGSYPGIRPGTFLDAGVHGADITVDDQGTVAAAATSLGFALSGPPEPELVVRADRPFLYVIRHAETGLVLFAGQVTDPG